MLSAYALTFGGLLCSRTAADLLGRRRLFVTGVLLFTVASLMRARLVAGGAPAARVVQGVGAAIMTPTALSIIATTFRDGAERNKALGIWGALGGIGATAAWLIGGPLVDGPGWEWIFFINIPLGLAALALAPLLLRESRAPTARRSYDPAGALTSTGALVLLVYALVEAPDVGWGIHGQSSSSPLGRSPCRLRAHRVAPPRALVPLRLLRSRTLVGANLVMLLTGAVAVGMPFVLTLYGQQVLGYSAVRFGLGSVVLAAGAAVGAIVASSRCPQSRLPDGRRDRHGAHGRGVAPAHTGLRKRLLRRHLLRAARLRSRGRPRLRARHGRGARGRRRARVRARLGPQQHRPPDRRRTRRRDPHDGCRLSLR